MAQPLKNATFGRSQVVLNFIDGVAKRGQLDLMRSKFFTNSRYECVRLFASKIQQGHHEGAVQNDGKRVKLRSKLWFLKVVDDMSDQLADAGRSALSAAASGAAVAE